MQLIHLFLAFRDIFSTVYALVRKKPMFYLRNKHVPTDPQHFSLTVIPNFHSCFYNSIATRRTCFIFLLENIKAKRGKGLVFFKTIKI